MPQPNSDKGSEYEPEEQPVYEECVPDPDRPGVWTIPGYITYNVRHAGDGMPANVKGLSRCAFYNLINAQRKPTPANQVDNLAFHDVDIPSVHFTTVPPTPVKPSSKPPPPPPANRRIKRGPLLRMWRLRTPKGGRKDRRAMALLCILVTAVVLLLAAVSVVLYLTVGGGLARLHGSRQSDDVSSLVSAEVEGSFRILNRPYVQQLANKKSPEFTSFSADVVYLMDSLFKRSIISNEYNFTTVTGFRNGSVIVSFLVRLRVLVQDAPKKVGMAFERGLVHSFGQILLGDFQIDFPSIKFGAPSIGMSIGDPTESIMLVHTETSTYTHPGTTSSAIVTDDDTMQSNVLHKTSTASTISIPPTTQTSTSANDNSAQELDFQPATKPTTLFHIPTIAATRINLPMPTRVSITVSMPPRKPPSISISQPPNQNLPPTYLPPPIFSTNRPSFRPVPPPKFSYSPRTPADLLVQWSEWSPWSECEQGPCSGTRTKMRTRECRTRNGTGPPLNDTRLCGLLGGVDKESRTCPCSGSMPLSHSRKTDFVSINGNTAPIPAAASSSSVPAARLCNECLPSEVCLALHTESFPICRPQKDPKDPLGCRGWCDPKFEYCQHLGNNSYRCVDDRSCLAKEWQCQDGLCIPEEKRCDGHFNCYDMTDEYDCECGAGFFHCGNNTSCLPNSKRCDGEIDCWDGQDEANCTKPCDPGFSPCNTGGCIPSFRFCDGYIDCNDSSDEPMGCIMNTCLETEFQCNNSRCLPKSAKCDGFDQCGDNSDETQCQSFHKSELPPTVLTGCKQKEFACLSGACIPLTNLCNGIEDCADRSDEHQNCSQSLNESIQLGEFNCPPSMYICQDGTCLVQEKVCDKLQDCYDGEDERNCSCSSSQFTCGNGHCILHEDVCDMVNDCGDFSDERECVYHSRYLHPDVAESNETEEISIQLLEKYISTDNVLEVHEMSTASGMLVNETDANTTTHK